MDCLAFVFWEEIKKYVCLLDGVFKLAADHAD